MIELMVAPPICKICPSVPEDKTDSSRTSWSQTLKNGVGEEGFRYIKVSDNPYPKNVSSATVKFISP